MGSISRFSLLALWLITTAAAMAPAARAQGTDLLAPFSLDDVARLAWARAQTPAATSGDSLPPVLRDLTYDQARDIRFKPDAALGRAEKLPFETMFFHPARQAETVLVNEIRDGGVWPVAYQGEQFDFGRNTLDLSGWQSPRHAGFRVHQHLNSPDYKDEIAVFLGASYFRALGAGQQYGLSARGLAIDTAGGHREEFPRFTEFWLERPAAGARTMTLFALLESPRATGAYRFVLMPGAETVVDVQSKVYARAGTPPINTLGVAPLTSMFLFGENQPSKTDFRPEVHDSDGLSVATADGEWLWRPLANPKVPTATSFSMGGLRGFGLMQRDRSFASYEDVEARYERRPSAWVEPVGDWGPGRVELLQLPTPDETHDNIVAYWVPSTLPTANEPLAMSYRVKWQGDQEQRPPSSRTVQTRRGIGYHALPAEVLARTAQFVVDFAGPALDALPSGAPVQAIATADGNGRIAESLVYRNPVNNTWRMTLRVERRDNARPTELRAFLQHINHTVSETWSHIVLPE